MDILQEQLTEWNRLIPKAHRLGITGSFPARTKRTACANHLHTVKVQLRTSVFESIERGELALDALKAAMIAANKALKHDFIADTRAIEMITFGVSQ
jgi:hypothetical protein